VAPHIDIRDGRRSPINTALAESSTDRPASRHDTCQGQVDRRASTKTIAAIGRQRRRLSIRVVTTPGTLLDAPIERAHSDHGPIEFSRELLEPARESRHVLDAIAGWMRRPHELQLRRLPAQLAHRRRCIGNVQITGLPVSGHRRRCRLRPRLRSKIQCRQHPYHRDRDGRRTKVTGLRPKIAIRNSVYAGPEVAATHRATRPNFGFKHKQLRQAPQLGGLDALRRRHPWTDGRRMPRVLPRLDAEPTLNRLRDLLPRTSGHIGGRPQALVDFCSEAVAEHCGSGGFVGAPATRGEASGGGSAQRTDRRRTRSAGISAAA
jgi:hypothetical protein